MAQAPARPSGLAAQLRHLEEVLEAEATPAALAELAVDDPERLAFLCEVFLGSLVRRGPAAAGALRRLFDLAAEAAGLGILPAATAPRLRAVLVQVERDLHEADAWDAGAPLWWSPLPPPGSLELFWQQLEVGSRPALPAPREIAAAFARGASRRWLSLARLLPPEVTAQVHRQLEAAREAGRLPLAREGIGAGGAVSSQRTDEVLYLGGQEAEVLAAAPALAVLAQWLLPALGERLRAALPGRLLAPPRRAMLARYPAPSTGYRPHLDNPGGERDNGRALTLTLYLNPEGGECAGGEIALWPEGAKTSDEPAALLPPRSGCAVLMDSRAIPHQVRPLAPGPARWALTCWLNDALEPPVLTPPVPRPTVTDVLLPIRSPAVPPGRLLFHEFSGEDAGPAGRIVSRPAGKASRKPRVGIVATVYRAPDLEEWCAHHLAVGADHLILIFDHLEEPAEDALARRLRQLHGPETLTLWGGREVAQERWPRLPPEARPEDLLRWAADPAAANSSWSVASRQALNASAALEAARGTELGGAPLDWLLHLDADERLWLEGRGRGAGDLGEHFAAASEAGWKRLRYLNHELLSGPPGEPPRFKLNPRLAAARLGIAGWQQLERHLTMGPADPRPWFNAYHNGKSAVAVEAAVAAAGVHGWSLREPVLPGVDAVLAGPTVLHHHTATATAFRDKYLLKATAEEVPHPRPFDPSPLEQAARALIDGLRGKGVSEEEIGRRLEELFHERTRFTDRELELLDEAGLIFVP